MRKLERSIDPDKFPKKFKGATRVKTHFDHFLKRRDYEENGQQGEFKISSKWSTAKDNLIEESLRKCGYCESKFTTTSFGDVEHFRPKSKYWWLAYEYFNYIAACAICNRKFKKANFKIKSGALSVPIVLGLSENELKDLVKKTFPDPLNTGTGITLG